MKTLLFILFCFAVFKTQAHEIEGTVVLEGSLKTETIVNYKKGTCKVKIKDVKNLMLEDQFGNPAYNILINKKMYFLKLIMMEDLMKSTSLTVILR